MLNLKKHKIVFLGDMGVGKTSIINQFMYGLFDRLHNPTIGVDFVSKSIVDTKKALQLQVWDTAGQERFHSLVPSYIRGCSVAVVVYDATNRDSFVSVDRWIEDIHKQENKEKNILVVSNKNDIKDSISVSIEEATDKCERFNCDFVEVSAKSGENIKLLFDCIISKVEESVQTNEDNKHITLKGEEPMKRESCSC